MLETTRYSAKGDCSVELMKTGMLKDVNKRCVELDQELAKRISDGGPVSMDAYAFVSGSWPRFLNGLLNHQLGLNYPDFGTACAGTGTHP